MRLRKTMMLLCSLILVFMAACSSGTGGGKSGQENSGNNAANAPATTEAKDSGANESTGEEEATGTPEMDFDMGGRTIKWVSWYSEEIPEDNPDNIKRKENLEALMKKHNFKIEYVVVDYGEYQNKITTSLTAGDPIGDIVRVARPWMIPTLVRQGMFHPVDEYTSNEKVFIPQYTNEYSNFEGRGYGFRAGVLGASGGVFYNRTLMNQLGLKPLQEYVDEDNWNWETFIEVAKQANRDTNNDGALDTWGLSTASLLVPAMASNEATLVKDGKQTLDDPKTLEVLNFLSRLVTDGIARPTEGGDWTEPGQFFRQGNTLMHAGQDYENDGFKTDMPDTDIGFVPFPKGPSGTQYQSFNTIPNYLTIPSTVENPEQLVYIYEKINDYDSIYDYPQQANFERLFSTEEDVANAKLAGQSMKIIENNGAYASMPFYEFQGEILEGLSVSTVVEKYKEPFQAALDEVWKK
jgi:ABC-type glycerol-3-phosphate transport system substrate-binding protein